jgi:hypothetical protein
MASARRRASAVGTTASAVVTTSRLLVMSDRLTETPGLEANSGDPAISEHWWKPRSQRIVSQFVDQILRLAGAFRGGLPRLDDVTVLMARYAP